ncbi:hypothetical protein HYT60_00585 [Candidatus Woesebacteria bacterium]|nr:hypothetical protein [Candidatus Woesebacteria bacterium]
MKKFFNIGLSAFAVVFAVPSFLILVSWNALPGDTLYGLKTGLEDIALILTIRTPLASAFSLNFTERRFAEANKLLAKKGSTVGYTLLVAGARETQTIIVDQKDTQKAEELIANIEVYQARIEEKKLAIATQPTAILPPQQPPATALPTPTQTAQLDTLTPATAVQVTAPIASPPPAPSTEAIIEDLETANQELEEIKEEIKKQLPPSASERARKEKEEHEKDNPRQD